MLENALKRTQDRGLSEAQAREEDKKDELVNVEEARADDQEAAVGSATASTSQDRPAPGHGSHEEARALENSEEVQELEPDEHGRD